MAGKFYFRKEAHCFTLYRYQSGILKILNLRISMMRRSQNFIFGGFEVLMSTTTWDNIIPKLQVIFEISSFGFFVELLVYKGNLLNSVELKFDRQIQKKCEFFESNISHRKKNFFSKTKILVAAGSAYYIDFRDEMKPCTELGDRSSGEASYFTPKVSPFDRFLDMLQRSHSCTLCETHKSDDFLGSPAPSDK